MLKTTLNDTNYRAKIVQLGAPKKHPNADKLQIFVIDFQNIITDLSYKEGDFVVYFPLECTINKDLIAYINGFETLELNKDNTKRGFFNKHARVRAVRLRGEPSQGFILNLNLVLEWLINVSKAPKFECNVNEQLNKEFDSFNDIIICQKYIPKINVVNNNAKQKQSVKGISRLVEGQFRLHNDTENLRKNVDKLNLDDYIGIHYKKHGTSFVCGNVLTKRKLKWFERLLKKLGVKIQDKQYDIIYSSRRVIKNTNF